VLTGANGAFSVPVVVLPGAGEGMWLRALCPGVPGVPGVPAAVSDPLHVPGTVSVTPASVPAPTPQATPPPAP
jgi:hypothetical protein